MTSSPVDFTSRMPPGQGELGIGVDEDVGGGGAETPVATRPQQLVERDPDAVEVGEQLSLLGRARRVRVEQPCGDPVGLVGHEVGAVRAPGSLPADGESSAASSSSTATTKMAMASP